MGVNEEEKEEVVEEVLVDDDKNDQVDAEVRTGDEGDGEVRSRGGT